MAIKGEIKWLIVFVITLAQRYREIRFISNHSPFPILEQSLPIKQKIYFLFLPYFDPILGYQRSMLQNCDTINESKYLIMGVNSYFRGKGYLSLNWNTSFSDLIFSKKIIMMSFILYWNDIWIFNDLKII